MKHLILILTCQFLCTHSVTLAEQPTRIVTLIATNDIHGYVLPAQFIRIDTQQKYTHGGLPVLASLIKIARDENPGNSLYFDSGDQFQGGLQSSPQISAGRLLNQFIEYVKLDGAAIGNHEFDFGYPFLAKFLSDRNTVNLAANIINQDAKIVLPKQQNSKLYTLQNGIKIGAIGLTTVYTPQRSPGWTLNDDQLKSIRFQEYKNIVQRQSRKLRSEGANAVILVSHVGQNCFVGSAKYGIWTQASSARQCDNNGQIHHLLKQLQKGTVDAILQGHYHAIAHNYIQGIPVVGNNMGGKYFNILYLQFRQNTLANTFIEGPIPVCEKVFANTMRCQYIQTKQQIQAAGELVGWKFHGKLVKPDHQLQEIIHQELQDKMLPFYEVLCYSQLLLKPSYDQETELNNLLARAVHSSTPADFTLLAPSLLRQTLYPGPIRRIDIYNFHPFNSPFVLVSLTGGALVEALRFLQSHSDSYHFSNELRQVVSLSQNRQNKGLISVSWYNGTSIDLEKPITGIVHNFTLSFIIQKFNITKIKVLGTVREIFEGYLKELGRISKDLGLMNPQKPHLIVQNVPNS